jgi:hypothetical protein
VCEPTDNAPGDLEGLVRQYGSASFPADASVTTSKLVDLNVTTAKIADGNVTNAKLADGSVTTAKIGSGAVDNTKVGTNVLLFSNIQQIATQRLVGRNTAGTGDMEQVTATQVLDWLGATQGQILYRDASAWAPLAPGAVGQVLKHAGSAANPSWAGGMTLLSSGTASAASTLDLALPTGYRYYVVDLGPGFVPNTNGTTLAARLSFDGGSTYLSTSTYSWTEFFTNTGAVPATGAFSSNDAGTWQAAGISLSAFLVSNNTAAASSLVVEIYPGAASILTTLRFWSYELKSDNAVNTLTHGAGNNTTSGVPTHVRILSNSGTITGKWAIYGVS